MKAAILAIGDEIVAGLTVDTNSAVVARTLRECGVDVVAAFAVADDEEAIGRALERALDDADLIVCTGGMGPTADDLTTACVGRLAGRELRLDPEAHAAMEARFRDRGLEIPGNNRRQAMLPEGCTKLGNPVGTATGFICPVERAGKGAYIACLPGVPHEMERMLTDELLPWMRDRQESQFVSRAYSTFGLTESKLDELLAGLVEAGEARLSFRAAFPRMQVRLTLSGAGEAELLRRLDALDADLRERLGDAVYATGDTGMEEVVGELLRRADLTLAVAESCTGGLIGHRITDVPGSSAYFLLGIVAYSNDAKRQLLSVSADTLEEFGAVSTQAAEAMAEGVRRRAGADLGLATTGIAGPGGGTPEKPVGTVCIALAWEGGAWSHRYTLGPRSREWVKGMTAQLALDRVRRHLLETSTV